MTEAIVKILLAYLLGSIMGGLLVGKLRGGVDIRAAGSGNAGASNAWRTQGPIFGIAVFVIDIGKGIIAALLLPQLALPGLEPAPAAVATWVPYGCGLAVMLGHVYPIFFGFRGGKGVATLMGVWACLLTLALPWALAVLVLTLVFTGYISLGSMLAGWAITLAAALQHASLASAPVLFALATALLLMVTHRANIARLLAGNENRFTRIMLFSRRSRHGS